MTTVQLAYSANMGEPFWYAYRQTLGTASSVLMLALLFLNLAIPIAERVERFKEKTLEIALSEPEPQPAPTPVPEQAAPPITPPPPAPVVQAVPRPVLPAVPAPAAEPVQAQPAPATEAVQRAATPPPIANSEPPRAAPPVVAAPQPAASAPSPAVKTDRYEAQILRYLESIKRYPSSREARQTRPSGIVTVWFELSRAGKVLDAGIEKGSNSSLLDYEALKTVRAGNFPPFPEGVFNTADRHRFAAHLSYELKTSD